MSLINEPIYNREPIGKINIPTVGYKNQLVESINGTEGGVCTIRFNGRRYFFRNYNVAADSSWIKSITANMVVKLSYGETELSINVPITSIFPKYGQPNWLSVTEWAMITIDDIHASPRNDSNGGTLFDVRIFIQNDVVTVKLDTNIPYAVFSTVKEFYFTVNGVTECVSGDAYTGQAHQSRYAEWANIANRATLASEIEAEDRPSKDFHEHGLYVVTVDINASAIGPGLEHLVTFNVYIPNGFTTGNLSSSVSVANGSKFYWLELENFVVAKVMSHDMNLGTLTKESGWTVVKVECIQFT